MNQKQGDARNNKKEDIMMKESRTFENYTVTREEKIICGADWRQYPEGKKVIVYEVTQHHPGFDEVILANDQRFKHAKKAVGW